jgi:hypothetical protein
MRSLLYVVLVAIAACADPAFTPIPLGQLVAPATPKQQSAAIRALLLPPRESLIWDVRAGGMTIGRAELDIGDTDVHSQFRTSAIASMFATIHHELVTTIDRAAARPQTATETLVMSGETDHTQVAFDGNGYTVANAPRVGVPDGNVAHTLHSALGWVRAWAAADAAPSYLYVLEDAQLFRLELARPMHEELRGVDTLRIDGVIRGGAGDAPIAMTLWLSADDERKPLRLTIIADKLHVTAELVSQA